MDYEIIKREREGRELKVVVKVEGIAQYLHIATCESENYIDGMIVDAINDKLND
jgi:hypothetical protein